MNPDKVRENRMRRMALRQGLRVVKSRRRDSLAVDFGWYNLVDMLTGRVMQPVKEHGFGFESLEDVRDELEMGRWAGFTNRQKRGRKSKKGQVNHGKRIKRPRRT